MSRANGSSEQQVAHVCIVGAGVCGLAALKSCLDEGLRVSCFDKSAHYGGLWRYRPEPSDEQQFEPSVMRTTILNTSKELSAFSDFAPKAELPNFMRHNLYMEYIDSYVEHFKLRAHLHLRHQVLECTPEWRPASPAGRQLKWLVRVKRLQQLEPGEPAPGAEQVLEFDKLMVAIGHHNIPRAPSYPGQASFRGQIMHSAQLKDVFASTHKFEGKRVLVVGLGNSACDAANDISLLASRCYVSCHRGQWIIARYLSDGAYDLRARRRIVRLASSLVPNRLVDALTVAKLERRTNHRALGLEPLHAPSENVPAINDLFPYKVYTGGVVLKNAVSSFTERGVVFEGEPGREYELDVVVLATGYEARASFLDEHKLGVRQPQTGHYELYLNVFAPRLALPLAKLDRAASLAAGELAKCSSEQLGEQQAALVKSLAFIGLVQPAGSLTVISELQSRWAARVFAGKLELPKLGRMLEHMDRWRRMRARAIRSHSRDQLVGDYIDYTDQLAAHIGCAPPLAKLLVSDPKLWLKLLLGPCVSYQYRLAGPGQWAQARATIMATQRRVEGGINEGNNRLLYKWRRRVLGQPLKGSAKV